MSLPKLTSLSTQTLSLLLERQRLQSLLRSSVTSNAVTQNHPLEKINSNLLKLREGILEYESKEGDTETTRSLRDQYERMRGMLGKDAELPGVVSLEPLESTGTASPPIPLEPFDLPPSPPSKEPLPVITPYTDDPEAGFEPDAMLQMQRQMMDEQDTHLEHLSTSINRQRDISLRINDELDVHVGLLEAFDTDVDTTQHRMGGARRRLDRFAKGAKENGSALAIGLLILVLLILIIVFKT